jgi:hypothetical protein
VVIEEPSFGLDSWNLTDNHSFNNVRAPAACCDACGTK